MAPAMILTVIRMSPQTQWIRARPSSSPALPTCTTRSPGLGLLARIANLQFSRRRWNETGPWPGISNGAAYADTGFQNTWDVSRAQPGTSGILVDYTGGRVTDSIGSSTARSDATQSTQVVTAAKRSLSQIEPVYPGLSATWNGRATLSLPHLDPNFNCSYSFWRVGQCHTIGGAEGLRQGNVHFAGEHTSVDFQGWMEGGANSGVRAASEVLADLK